MVLGLFVDAGQDQGLNINSSSFKHKQRNKQTTHDAAFVICINLALFIDWGVHLILFQQLSSKDSLRI